MAGKEIAVKKYVVRLSGEEREQLSEFVRSGKRSARLLTKARILLKADASEAGEGWSDGKIAEALDTSVANVERTRRQLVEEGLEAGIGGRLQLAIEDVDPVLGGPLLAPQRGAGVTHGVGVSAGDRCALVGLRDRRLPRIHVRGVLLQRISGISTLRQRSGRVSSVIDHGHQTGRDDHPDLACGYTRVRCDGEKGSEPEDRNLLRARRCRSREPQASSRAEGRLAALAAMDCGSRTASLGHRGRKAGAAFPQSRLE